MTSRTHTARVGQDPYRAVRLYGLGFAVAGMAIIVGSVISVPWRHWFTRAEFNSCVGEHSELRAWFAAHGTQLCANGLPTPRDIVQAAFTWGRWGLTILLGGLAFVAIVRRIETSRSPGR